MQKVAAIDDDQRDGGKYPEEKERVEKKRAR